MQLIMQQFWEWSDYWKGRQDGSLSDPHWLFGHRHNYNNKEPERIIMMAISFNYSDKFQHEIMMRIWISKNGNWNRHAKSVLPIAMLQDGILSFATNNYKKRHNRHMVWYRLITILYSNTSPSKFEFWHDPCGSGRKRREGVSAQLHQRHYLCHLQVGNIRRSSGLQRWHDMNITTNCRYGGKRWGRKALGPLGD